MRKVEDAVTRRKRHVWELWGRVEHHGWPPSTQHVARHEAASIRLNVTLLLMACLLSVPLAVIAAHLPLNAHITTSSASAATTTSGATSLSQGGAVASILTDFQAQQAGNTPHAMLRITASKALVAWRLTQNQPCHEVTMFVAQPSAWVVPPGCYGRIYRPDPRKYQAEVAFGTCTWWVEALHQPDILASGHYRQGSVPKPGAIAVISAGVQGAGKTGHYAEVIAVAPDGYWMLVSEMNFHWRGAGFGLVDFRYIHVGEGVSFLW